jgi:curved DNA-binding protein CbpA
MDHYEELGLRRTATDEEIRAAYRALARLLHPDGQPDGPARSLAECQMRRLNQVVETLSNPSSRAAYDRRLERGSKRHVSRRRAAPWSRPGLVVWASTAAIAILCLLFFFREEVTRRPENRSPSVAPSRDIEALKLEIERLERELRQARRTRE